MTDLNPKPPGAGGGSVATRGLLVQTLVALLDVARAESSFTEITLEPAVGNEQFDFLWKYKDGSYATQVKSTVNSFTKADVEKWAKDLLAARSTEHCRLVLVGNIPPRLVGLKSVDSVTIDAKNLHLDDLVEQAAQRLAAFLEGEKQPSGTAAERVMVVHALVSKLQHLSAASERFSREEFIKLLTRWVKEAPRQGRPIDISRILKYAPAELIGRNDELKLLNDAWAKVRKGTMKRAHLLTFVALGGEGKTSLVGKWVAELAHQDWPGCDAAFAWSFYSQGTREQLASSSDLFLKEALNFFGDEAMAGSAAGSFDKGRRLAHLVGERRSLLILDGLEPLQYAPTSPTPGELKDQGVAALLKGLAAASHGLCVVTTRYSLPDLKAFWQTTAPEVNLLRLSRKAGVNLLQKLGIKGSLLRNIPFDDGKEQVSEFEKLVEDVKGHALTLTLLGTYLRDAHGGDIRKRDFVKLEEADAEEQGGHAFRVMEAYELAFEREGDKGKHALSVLRLLGLFDRPATADCLGALWNRDAIPGLTEPLVGLSKAQRNIALKRLEDAKLLTVNRDAAGALVSLDAHPLLREYFARQGHGQQPDAWRAAHRRLYQHLCATTPDKSLPTLEDLQPLYQAVAHGCQAGCEHDAWANVFAKRIMRTSDGTTADYTLRQVGALSLDLSVLGYFFHHPYDQLAQTIPSSVRWMIVWAVGTRLCALGKLADADDILRAEKARCQKVIDNNGLAEISSVLSESSTVAGDLTRAITETRQSTHYALLRRKPLERWTNITHLAYLRFQTGNVGPHTTLRIFEAAERLLRKTDPEYPRVHLGQFWQHCYIVLASAEVTCWKEWLRGGTFSTTRSCDKLERIPLRANAVIQRQEDLTALDYVNRMCRSTLVSFKTDRPLLAQALDQCSLDRSILFSCLLGCGSAQQRNDLRKCDFGINLFNCSSFSYYQPCGHLARAWALSFMADVDRAKEEVNRALEVSERAPMKLHMADIHLYRARLFFREKVYPWKSPQDDLAAAEKLINESGYHRRDEELADAKRAILGT